ncbi:hypothetical protein [Streptomyces hoynatensis]|uniref:Uncharacterized protein n=1 Tax=Streptomyces hoynatensis TaxID=1141874 RepID=A0A3A9YM64_9ACTN|nr:hypothetical protein [Streptomyces hoynatensis]RKN35877.1 hypothetical protein D7294_30695 [Streptomyces hoynatensis]
MTRYVMAATDAGGGQREERTVSVEPTLDDAAAFGGRHGRNYVAVRYGHDDITLYGRDAAGAWSVLVTHAPAAVVVVRRREHDAECRPEPDWEDGLAAGDPLGYLSAPEAGYLLSAVDVAGESFGDRGSATAPTLGEAAEWGERHEANYVLAGPADGDVVTLYGRDAGGGWSVVAAGVDVETAWEACLWFDLTQHYAGGPVSPGGGPGNGPGPGADSGADSGGGVRHPLDLVPEPAGGRMAAERAISLVVERIRARGLDYPTRGLAADRFDGGWSVYAPAEVDESDPMAFLDLPVGRSVFLVGDLGRVKEISSSVPPPQAERMFAAEEAYVRRGLADERFLAELGNEAMRRDAESGGAAGIASFTVEPPGEEATAARASALLAPLVQQVALLGPPGWNRFEAAFSCTVSGEVARLRFWSGKRSAEVPVPEQIALLVRRQRHLAARMPAGPWWRLLLTVGHTEGTDATIATEYDYGDRPFPDGQLLAPEHYRDDLLAYPRAEVPAWLAAHAARAGRPGGVGEPGGEPGVGEAGPGAAGAGGGGGAGRAAAGPARVAPPAPAPVLDAKVGWSSLHADPQVITYGRKSIELDQAEWVGYASTHTTTKRFLGPTSHQNTWEFRVGRYPYHGGPGVTVQFFKAGRHAEPPGEWLFLVNLVRQYLEPRLLADLVERVRRGETVTAGGSVKVSRDGIACAKPRVSLPWGSFDGARLDNGMVCVRQAGVERPVLTVPLSHPNATLLPALFAALAP